MRSKTRQQVLDAFLDAARHPLRADSRSSSSGQPAPAVASPVLAGCFFEHHQPEAGGEKHLHAHLVVKFDRSVRFAPIKRALLERHGFASHWKGGFA